VAAVAGRSTESLGSTRSMTVARYIGGVALGLVSCFAVWLSIAGAHPIFNQLALSGLVPIVAGGVIGGLVSGVFAPRHKLAFSSLVGLALAAVLLGYMAARNMTPGLRNPLIWYWPAYLIPSFILGGILSRRLWNGAA
jgi:hypothetical protein